NYAGNADIFVAKFSPSGQHIWSKCFGSAATDSGSGVGVDGSDNIFVAAKCGTLVNFGNGITLTGYGIYDIALVKFSGATGATLWAKLYGGAYEDYACGLAVDRSGDVAVTGKFGGGDLGGGQVPAGLYVAKYSGADGSYRWAKVMSVNGTGFGITTDPTTGNVIATGNCAGSADFGGGPVDAASSYCTFLSAFDASGKYLW